MMPSERKLIFFAPSAYTLGGVQSWLAQLVPQLRAHGWNASLAVPDGQCHLIERYRAAFPQLPCLPLTSPSGSREGRLRSIHTLLRREQPDLALGVNIVDLYPAAWRARRAGHFGGRVAMTLHGIDADVLADLFGYRPVIDALIATNQLSCVLSREIGGISPERVFYAPYGVPVDATRATDNQETGVEPAPLSIAWVGRLEQPQKRIQHLPPILQRLDELGVAFILSIAGDGPEADAIALSLAPWIRCGKVRLLGKLSSQQLHEQVYSSHQILLITSSWETGPIVAWEAMAAGMVVVSSRYLGSRLEGSLRHETNCLLFESEAPHTAADQLARLRDPGLRGALARGGHQLVIERYSSAASLASWERALRAVLALPKLPFPGPAPCSTASAGRLDRWVGPQQAENLRSLLGLRFLHKTPGSEWPHSDHDEAETEALLSRALSLEASKKENKIK